jgi:hypothetical protein
MTPQFEGGNGAPMAKQRIKPEEVADKVARKAHEEAARSQEIARRSRFDQEIRFAKTQQLAATTATITLLGAMVGIQRLLEPLQPWQRSAGVIAAAIIAIIGIETVWSLQGHLSRTRLQIDHRDDTHWSRGSPIMWAYILVLFFSAIIVGYIFRRVAGVPTDAIDATRWR